jgi:hypothetical protein
MSKFSGYEPAESSTNHDLAERYDVAMLAARAAKDEA